MTRSAAREIAIQLGFSVAAAGVSPQTAVEEFLEPEHYASLEKEDAIYSERPCEEERDFILRSVTGVTECRAQLDDLIGRYAKGWRIERISRSAAAIMRQAIYEILYMPDIPDAVSMDEAVELAKRYVEPDVVAFINGVLGGFYRGEVQGTDDRSGSEQADGEMRDD